MPRARSTTERAAPWFTPALSLARITTGNSSPLAPCTVITRTRSSSVSARCRSRSPPLSPWREVSQRTNGRSASDSLTANSAARSTIARRLAARWRSRLVISSGSARKLARIARSTRNGSVSSLLARYRPASTSRAVPTGVSGNCEASRLKRPCARRCCSRSTSEQQNAADFNAATSETWSLGSSTARRIAARSLISWC